MHGMFRSNGGCGYVKKPDFLMNVGPNDRVFDPKEKLQVKKTLRVSNQYDVKLKLQAAYTSPSLNAFSCLQVIVYMGDGWHLDFKQTHFDLYSPPDFYCRVSCELILY